jgi:hypothetical protein
MKLVIYTLNANGTIPEYIIDGGHLPWSNNQPSPRDLDLVGVAIDEAPQIGFATKAELLAYAESKEFVFKDPKTEEVVSLENVISKIWDKIVDFQ